MKNSRALFAYAIADIVLQLSLLAIWVWLFFEGSYLYLLFYPIVGSWFLLSVLIHYNISNNEYEKIFQIFLSVVCGVAFFTMAALLINTAAMFFCLIALFVVSPFFALLYTINCFAQIIDYSKVTWPYLNS
jgi:hypothetical protein